MARNALTPLYSFAKPHPGRALILLRLILAAGLFAFAFWFATLVEPEARAASNRFWTIPSQTQTFAANPGPLGPITPESAKLYSLTDNYWELQPFWVSFNWKTRVAIPLAVWSLIMLALVWLLGTRIARPRPAYWTWLSIALLITAAYSLIVFPLLALLIWLLPPIVAPVAAGLIVTGMLAYAAITPAFIARRAAICTTRLPLSRWRPVCPECGQQIRGAPEPRCAECGTPFLSSARTYRRWAVHRLPWDQKHRGSLITAYFRTLLTILFRPCTAARRLSIPDRMGRAWRWAIVHLLVAAFVPVGFLLWRQVPKWFDPAPPGTTWPALPSLVVRNLESDFQIFLTRIVWLGGMPAAALLFASLIPMIQPAARRSLSKWTLYATPFYLIPFITLVSVRAVQFGTLSRQATTANMVSANSSWLYQSGLSPSFLIYALLFAAALWGSAAASNLYLARRNPAMALLLLTGNIATWLALVIWVTPPGLLEKLQ